MSRRVGGFGLVIVSEAAGAFGSSRPRSASAAAKTATAATAPTMSTVVQRRIALLTIRSRRDGGSAESPRMAPRKRPKHLRPKSPARVRKRKHARRRNSQQHPELIGLALAFVGAFLAIPL